VELSSAANDNLIDRTIGLWRPRCRRDLSREDARQIVENITGFLSILHKWARAEAAADAAPKSFGPVPPRLKLRAQRGGVIIAGEGALYHAQRRARADKVIE